MKQQTGASLKPFNSFSVEARAASLVAIESERDLLAFAAQGCFTPGRDLLLGGGTNVLFASDVQGTVVLNRIPGKRILHDDGESVLVEVCSGENWHTFVCWTLEQGLAGLENLSLIPGLAGAAPIQNIGAYGVELSESLESVQAVDLETGRVHEFERDACGFAYRDSRFKSAAAEGLMISHVRLRLSRRFHPRLAYEGLAAELEGIDTADLTALQVSEAVIRLRRRKLPDPAVHGNAGSFFKNPRVEPALAQRLASDHPGMPLRPARDGRVKLSAGWMIQHCGWKGHRDGDAAVSDIHALVLLNLGNARGRELLDLAVRIRDSVKAHFGVELEPEPSIIA